MNRQDLFGTLIVFGLLVFVAVLHIRRTRTRRVNPGPVVWRL